MRYQLLTTVILAVHFAYLAFVVFGGFLTWRWPRLIWVHLATAAWGIVIVSEVSECPLTWAESWARQQAGEAGLTRGFMDRYIEGVLYPERYTGLMQALAGLTVLASWLGLYLLRRRSRPSRRVTAA